MPETKKILLIDDDLTLSEMYAERLKAAGYMVSIAHDGEAGLAEAAKGPELILLDIMMPKVNGLDVLKTLKNEPKTAEIPVILLTALIQELDKSKGLTTGATDYYVKSEVLPGELVKRVDKVLNKAKDEELKTKN